MKVVCTINTSTLTSGKIYDVIAIGSYYLRLFDDCNNLGEYWKIYFITLEEYRDKKLKELGI